MQEFRQVLFFKLDWLRQPWNLMDFASSAIVWTIIVTHLVSTCVCVCVCLLPSASAS